MNKHFQFFALAFALFASASLFAQPAGNSRPRPGNYKLGTDSVAMFIPVSIPATAVNGEYVIGKSKTDGTEIIVVLRQGYIAETGYRPAGGRFVAVTPYDTPCNSIICLSYQQKKCFDLNGNCICICGSWFSANN